MHLNYLIEMAEKCQLKYNSELSNEDALSINQCFLSEAKNAMCFDLGDIEAYCGIDPIEELSRHPPFKTCYYEFALGDTDKTKGKWWMGVLCVVSSNGNVAHTVIQDDQTSLAVRGVMLFKKNNEGMNTYEIIPYSQGEWFKIIGSALKVFNSILNCKNIQLRKVEPDAPLQKKRQKRGKLPLFSYHVLELKNSASEPGQSLGGTHASPRFHLRRGHIRRYEDGSYTWVNAHTVGDKKLGMVHKEYRYATQ